VAGRILLTGALGQLGQALRAVFENRAELLPLDLKPTRSGVSSCDITQWPQVQQAAKAFRPDVIINAAAYTDVDGNERNPDLAEAVNARGVGHLLDAASAVGAKLVQISTDYVFDGMAGPYLENDPTHPMSVYGRTKLAAEKLVAERGGRLVIRANVLFGPDLDAQASFVRWVVQSLREGQPIRVVDDQINNPTLTTHLAEAVRAAVEQDATGLYHYGGLEFANRYEFAEKIADHFGLLTATMAPASTAELEQLAHRPLKSGLICSKMKMDLEVANYTISDALAQAFPLS